MILTAQMAFAEILASQDFGLFQHNRHIAEVGRPTTVPDTKPTIAMNRANTFVQFSKNIGRHGFLDLDNNTAERSMRPIALGRKYYLFLGSKVGCKSAAIAYTLIETAKLNGVDPQAWLTEFLGRFSDHKIARIDELMLWRYAPPRA
jgi:hypothetical protein